MSVIYTVNILTAQTRLLKINPSTILDGICHHCKVTHAYIYLAAFIHPSEWLVRDLYVILCTNTWILKIGNGSRSEPKEKV